MANPTDNLSDHFTFGELTKTQIRDLQDTNTEQAQNYVPTLTRVATELLEPIRAQFGPIMVDSGFRCQAVNTAVGGAPTSQHVLGQAADINSPSMNTDDGRKQLAAWVKVNLKDKFHQALVEFGCLHVALATGENDNQVFFAERINGQWVKTPIE